MLQSKTVLIPVLLLISMLVWGCASTPKPIEITDVDFAGKPVALINSVPFAEQTSILCGPTSLFMVSKNLKPNMELKEVTDLALTPGASGSFKQDMMAAVRRIGLAPYRVSTLSQIFAYLAEGTPVVIFHETSFFTKHFWHYSVLTGYNRIDQSFYVHIGPYPHHPMDFSEVVRSWEIGGRWAMVVRAPEDLPRLATLEEARDNAITFLHLGKVSEAETLGLAMQKKWPDRYEAEVILADASSKNQNHRKAYHFLKLAVRKEPQNAVLKRLVHDLQYLRHGHQKTTSQNGTRRL